MALNWNIEDCKDFKELTNDDNWEVTNQLIWLTMYMGISEITRQNAKVFTERANKFQQSQKIWYFADTGEPVQFTLDQVKRRIGLRTNASELTDKEFNAKLKRLEKAQ